MIVATPSLAHRDKKINLNYPLPVSNDPNEPIRQKWISDTYQLLKAILPPTAVDTPEELAQLSQFVINIIDFRDPDCTMTHWVNPDVMIAGLVAPHGTAAHDSVVPRRPRSSLPTPRATAATVRSTSTAWSTTRSRSTRCWLTRTTYLPSRPRTQTNRFFVELVNTLTRRTTRRRPAPAAPGGANPPDPSPTLDLGGFTITRRGRPLRRGLLGPGLHGRQRHEPARPLSG